MLVNRLTNRVSLFKTTAFRFGGVHHKQYDWRDDHSLNSSFERDPRMIDVQLPDTYSFPYQVPKDFHPKWEYSAPSNYNPKDLSINMVKGQPIGKITNLMEAPHSDYMADIAHQFDYQSQDLDYQAQSFKSQHFRKKGPLWMWVIAAGTPIWFFANDLVYQGWDDLDFFRYQRPPPLNFPDDEDTPDLQYVELFDSEQYKDLQDAGVVCQPFFEIVDGVKIYSKWAGVNQPAPNI